MAGRIVRRGSQQLRAELALVEACEPIEEAHLDAKDAYQQAVASGDAEAIREAKRVKVETGNRLNETREWLRREAEVVKLQTVTIPKLERVLAGPMLVPDGKGGSVDDAKARADVQAALAAARAELTGLSVKAAETRTALEALGGQVVGDPVVRELPPGSAEVTAPAITVRPRAGKAEI